MTDGDWRMRAKHGYPRTGDEAEGLRARALEKAAIQKAIDWVIHLIEKENGALKHSYTAQEQGVFECNRALCAWRIAVFLSENG